MINLLTTDMAYNSASLPQDLAEEYFDRFIDDIRQVLSIQSHSNLCQNCAVESLKAFQGGGYLLGNTFESGSFFACEGSQRIGVLWIGDED
jgi:hypothetical protein